MSEYAQSDERVVLEQLERYSGNYLSALRSINETLGNHDFRLRDLRSSTQYPDDRLKLFSSSERILIGDLRRDKDPLVDRLPVRDALFYVAALKEPERDAAGAAFTIVAGGIVLAVFSGAILWWIDAANGGIDDWGAITFMACVGVVLFAWAYGIRKRDEHRARRAWRSARERAGF